MLLGLMVSGATRRIQTDQRGSTAGGATQSTTPIALLSTLEPPAGAPLPALGPCAAVGSRSSEARPQAALRHQAVAALFAPRCK